MSRILRTAAGCAVGLLLGGTGVVCTPAMAFEIEAFATSTDFPSGGTKRVCQQVTNPMAGRNVGPYKVYKKLQDSCGNSCSVSVSTGGEVCLTATTWIMSMCEIAAVTCVVEGTVE